MFNAVIIETKLMRITNEDCQSSMAGGITSHLVKLTILNRSYKNYNFTRLNCQVYF